MRQMPAAVSSPPVPEHVPAWRVRDVNLYDYPVDDGDVQLGLLRLREAGAPETFWSPHNGGHWVVTRAAAIETVINDAARFSNRYIGVPKALNPVRLFRPLQVDAPDHAPYRLLLAGAFSPRAVTTLQTEARRLTVELIEGFRARGECEFVTEFAQHMPIGIFMSITGLPKSERLALLAIAEKVARPKADADRMEGYQELDDYILDLIEGRRTCENDFVAELRAARIDGRSLDADELTGVIALTLIAGLDTVSGMLGFFARFLAQNPDRRRELRANPGLIPGAVEELLRRYAHVLLAREVREDLELDGVAMKKGDMVVASLALHNLDEAVFADPLRIDFARSRKPAHVTFGGQTHRCMGAGLARAELQIFLEEWLARIPEFQVAPGAEIEVRTRVTSIMPRLPLVWDVA
jgi:cytochrome P450